jgi:hypothetical protein
MPDSLDVDFNSGSSSEVRHTVGYPVGVPWAGVRRIVGEQVGAVREGDADLCERGPDFIEVGCDERARDGVDGEPAVLVGLSVFPELLAALNNEGYSQ